MVEVAPRPLASEMLHSPALDDSWDEHRQSGSATAPRRGNNFQVVSDRRATALDLEAFEWNSTMDLLACLTAPPDSTLSVYRLLSDEQSPKLLSEKISGVGTALAWSPCGRKIAVGDRLGVVAIYDGESGAVLHTRRLHRHPVVALSWTSASTSDISSLQVMEEEPPATAKLPPLLTVPSAINNIYGDAVDAGIEPIDADGFTMLVSVDEGGTLMVSSSGTFPLQAVQLFPGEGPIAMRGETASPGPEKLRRTPLLDVAPRKCLAASLSPDLRQLAVVLSPHRQPPVASTPRREDAQGSEEEMPSAGSIANSVATTSPQQAPAAPKTTDAGHSEPPGPAWAIVLDVRTLAIRRQQLVRTAGVVEQLVAVIEYLRAGVETLGNVWHGTTHNFTNKMRGLIGAVESSAAAGDAGSISVHMDLLSLLCMGSPSKGVQDFIKGQTSPQQLLRLSRTIEQALGFINMTVSTRLQVAALHILTLTDDLLSHAGAEKYKVFGMMASQLDDLRTNASLFLEVVQDIVLQCSQARMFTKVLFQVLLQIAHRLAEPPLPHTADMGVPTPSAEDVAVFIERMQSKKSVDLSELSERIGMKKTLQKGQATSASPSTSRTTGDVSEAQAEEMSLDAVVQKLLLKGAEVGDDLLEALSANVRLLADMPIETESPWARVSSPELQKMVASEATAQGATSIRSLSNPRLSVRWEVLPPPEGCRLLVLSSREAELRLLRLWVPPAPLSAQSQPALSQIRLSPSLVTRSRSSLPAYFMLGELYDASSIAALALRETPDGGAVPIVCLLNIADVEFHSITRRDSDMDVDSALEASPLATLPAECVKRRVLDGSFMWTSAMRVMCSRGMCSIYAWRTRRMLTLDMEAEEEEDEDGAA